jgi:hypothetical protein
MNMGLNITLIRLIGVTGAIGSIIISVVVSISIMLGLGRKYLIVTGGLERKKP